MSKRVESKLERFPGYVVLRDPLSFALVMKYDEARAYIRRDAVELAEKYSVPKGFDFSNESIEENAKTNSVPQLMEYIGDRFRRIQERYYPLIFDVVEEWHLDNSAISPRESFPNATPGTSADAVKELTGWLITECRAVYNGHEDADPNA